MAVRIIFKMLLLTLSQQGKQLRDPMGWVWKMIGHENNKAIY